MSLKKILCIDDNPSILECLEWHFGSKGYTVLSSLSGTCGLELLATNTIDIVIVDYQMPEMNGAEVAAAIKTLRPGIPVVMFSGASDIPERDLEFVDAFVEKNQQDSLGTIEKVIDTLLTGKTSLPTSFIPLALRADGDATNKHR